MAGRTVGSLGCHFILMKSRKLDDGVSVLAVSLDELPEKPAGRCAREFDVPMQLLPSTSICRKSTSLKTKVCKQRNPP